MFSSIQSLAAAASSAARHFIVQLPGGFSVAATSREDQQLALETIRDFIEMQEARGAAMASSPPTARVEQEFPPSPARLADAVAYVEPEAVAIAHPTPEPVDPGKPLYGTGIPAPSAPPMLSLSGPHRDANGNTPIGVYHQILPRTLSLAAEHYLDDIDQRVSDATMKESRFILRVFQDLVGDRLVHTIDADDTRTFLKALKAWPSHAGRKLKLCGLSPKKLVEKSMREGLKVIATSTCQKHIDHLRAFFRWCKAQSYCFADLLVGARRNAVTATATIKKKPFEENEVVAIFDAERLKSYGEPHKFWVPLIGLFMGMRVNEICQLFVDDVFTDRIPTIRISDEQEGQRLKTESSHRLVPIHPKLIELGFLDYVADVRKMRSRHLFPGLKWGANGPGETLSNWFNRTLLKALGIKSRHKTLHSLRHTFCTSAERHHVPIHRIARLVGHAPTGDVTLEHYVAEAAVTECLRDIKRVRFPKLNLPRYDGAQFHDYLMHVTAPGYTPKHRRTKKEKAAAGMGEDALSMLL